MKQQMWKSVKVFCEIYSRCTFSNPCPTWLASILSSVLCFVQQVFKPGHTVMRNCVPWVGELPKRAACEWLEHKHDFNLVIHPISSLLRLLYRSFPAFRVCREGLCLRHNNQSEWMWPLCGTVGALINFDLARICMIFDFAQASEDDHHIASISNTNVRISARASITYDIWKWLEYF